MSESTMEQRVEAVRLQLAEAKARMKRPCLVVHPDEVSFAATWKAAAARFGISFKTSYAAERGSAILMDEGILSDG